MRISLSLRIRPGVRFNNAWPPKRWRKGIKKQRYFPRDRIAVFQLNNFPAAGFLFGHVIWYGNWQRRGCQLYGMPRPLPTYISALHLARFKTKCQLSSAMWQVRVAQTCVIVCSNVISLCATYNPWLRKFSQHNFLWIYDTECCGCHFDLVVWVGG